MNSENALTVISESMTKLKLSSITAYRWFLARNRPIHIYYIQNANHESLGHVMRYGNANEMPNPNHCGRKKQSSHYDTATFVWRISIFMTLERTITQALTLCMHVQHSFGRINWRNKMNAIKMSFSLLLFDWMCLHTWNDFCSLLKDDSQQPEPKRRSTKICIAKSNLE